jgi:tryptophan halogenase
MKVESICIVGGGSSGWMSAALLSKSFSNIEICLIESEVSKPIGVGESTLGHFNRFLNG